MMLLQPAADACPICATKHPPNLPHNAQSIYYQYRFYGIRGRWPTWADALAHCDIDMQLFWRERLIAGGHWTEPPDGQEPIADPPAESVHQTVGDIHQLGFGPAADPSLEP